MKKLSAVLAFLLIVLQGVFFMSGCEKSGKGAEETFDYAALYRSERTEPYPEEDRLTTRARYGYTLSSEQGYNGWYYLFGSEEEYAEMTFDASSGEWRGGGAAMSGEELRPSSDAAAVRMTRAAKDGNAVLYGNFKCADSSSAAAEIAVFAGGEEVYSGALQAGDTVGKYFEVPVSLRAGEEVYFSVKGEGASVLFDPVVTFESAQNESLYHLTATGKQYGDVFPYYDEDQHRLYMGFLWSDNAALADNYHDALEISDNMLTFADVPEADNYDVWQYYKDNYRINFLYDVNRFADSDIYTFGVRDNMLYFDEENRRYLMIAGCYYRFDSAAQTSDLVIYASDDPMALSWTEPGNVVEAGYSRNLPECPSLMKIGDRWYVFVSVAYNTVHQVGPLQYWTGDEGVDCMDVDWSDKDYAFLDGEDLCAARPTQVGDKVYMWGWIPSTYDTMPWAPWAGYLNLPREVVVREDGSLGGRLDPGLSALLNFGNLYTLGEGNFAAESGSAFFSDGALSMNGQENTVRLGDFHRTYVTFRVDMGTSDKIGYVMRQDGREYRVVIERENGKLYMKVLSPDDPSHKVNSTIELPAQTDVFDVQIVNDGEFIEFFVNGECALTAHTAMAGDSHTAYLYSDGQAVFSDVKVNKLRPYGDI